MQDNNDLIEQIFNSTLPQHHGNLHNHINALLETYGVSNVNMIADDEFNYLLKKIKKQKGVFND